MYQGANGVKTGFTKKCGRCLVSSAQRNGVSLIAVTLKAPDDWNDHKKMLDYGFETAAELLKLAGSDNHSVLKWRKLAGVSFETEISDELDFVKRVIN